MAFRRQTKSSIIIPKIFYQNFTLFTIFLQLLNWHHFYPFLAFKKELHISPKIWQHYFHWRFLAPQQPSPTTKCKIPHYPPPPYFLFHISAFLLSRGKYRLEVWKLEKQCAIYLLRSEKIGCGGFGAWSYRFGKGRWRKRVVFSRVFKGREVSIRWEISPQITW